tara:strand:- start:437 stop:826 length:390 start_codon:yes stop_codon:yes gene_type:complete
MEKEQIKISSNRSFGIVFFIFFLAVSLWPLINGENIRLSFLTISIIFLILGIVNSKILTPLNKLWFKLGLLLGKIVSPIVMGIIFFFIVTPTGIIMRLIKKDLLNLKKNNSKTYWIEKKNENTSMKNQF